MRRRNTDSEGLPFSNELAELVWQKANVLTDENPDMYRMDICGSVICFQDYGNTYSKLGWEIDHIRPISKNGCDKLNNLQPLQWQNNRNKGNKWPWNKEKCNSFFKL